MKIKKSYLLIIIFALIISCSNPSTNPDNNNNQNTSSSIKAVTSGVHTIQYGSKTSEEIDVSDKNKLKDLWISLVSGKTIYKSSYYTSVNGTFDTEGNYYDITDESNIRTKLIECAVYEYNNKTYLAAVYWDNKTGTGMQERYRLIITDENGAEQAWFGGGGDATVIPDKNTQWTKYYFVFGYLKEY